MTYFGNHLFGIVRDALATYYRGCILPEVVAYPSTRIKYLSTQSYSDYYVTILLISVKTIVMLPLFIPDFVKVCLPFFSSSAWRIINFTDLKKPPLASLISYIFCFLFH